MRELAALTVMLALAASAAAASMDLRAGVPNAAYFARKNVTGNQHFFCFGDSKTTP